MKRVLLNLPRLLIFLLAFGGALPDSVVSADSSPRTSIKIMPLGDSITFGTRDPGYGGYRHLLRTLLINNGYAVRFVGSQKGSKAADSDNEGHPGWTIAQIQNGIDTEGWLEAYQPNVVLLHIGTNDIRRGNADAAPGRLADLLDDILRRLPQTHVIVAQIIPFRRGLEQGNQAYNAAIPDIAASKGPRVSIVDMQNILSRDDYADGIHPNADGYDKMARAWEPAIRVAISGSVRHADVQLSATSSSGEAQPSVPATLQPAVSEPVLRYLASSTVKLEQLIGDKDKERHQLTRSQTVTRFQLEGTDLGYSFEHEGRAYFLFGDTLGRLDRALDTIATTDAHDPETGVRLDFLTVNGEEQRPIRTSRRGELRRPRRQAQTATYLTIQPPGISMGAFEVPVSGISLAGHMYVVVSTNHSPDRTTDRSVLTRFTPPANFEPLRTISQLPAGRFVKMSMHVEPRSITGLPPGGPFIILWGTGAYRRSDAYLSIVPAAHLETGEGTRYFAGLDGGGLPAWSAKESDAAPIVKNGTMGDLSVTWCRDLSLWLMTYDRREPDRSVAFAYARTPWGPWSEPQVIFNAVRDGALGKFIHDPRSSPDDGLAGPVIGKGKADPAAVHGGAYAPYVVERWTKLHGSELDLYYLLSTWNPYVVVLMKSRLQVEQKERRNK